MFHSIISCKEVFHTLILSKTTIQDVSEFLKGVRFAVGQKIALYANALRWNFTLEAFRKVHFKRNSKYQLLSTSLIGYSE